MPGPNSDPSGASGFSTMMLMMIGWLVIATALFLFRPSSMRRQGDEKPSSMVCPLVGSMHLFATIKNTLHQLGQKCSCVFCHSLNSDRGWQRGCFSACTENAHSYELYLNTCVFVGVTKRWLYTYMPILWSDESNLNEGYHRHTIPLQEPTLAYLAKTKVYFVINALVNFSKVRFTIV